MPGLTHSIPPDVLDPANRVLNTGDPKDDDAIAIDETLEAGPTGPQTYGEPKPPKDKLPEPTRLITRRITVGTDTNGTLFDPVQLFPADIRRKAVIISLDAVPATGLNSPKIQKQIIQQNVAYTNPSGTTTLPTVTVPPGSLVWAYLRAITINGTTPTVQTILTESPGPSGGSRQILASPTVGASGGSNTTVPSNNIPTFTDTITPTLVWGGTVTDATIDLVIYVQPPTLYQTPAEVTIAAQKSNVYDGTKYSAAGGPITFTDHTGAVWVYSTAVTLINVNAWAVSE